MSVVVKNLTKIYDQQKAVNDISFSVCEGEILGFLGPNGAGKSTTMKIATTFLPPSSGQILVNGIDVVKDPLSVRKIIGYLPEHNPLYLDLYVKEYLEYIASLHGIRGLVRKKKIKEIISLILILDEPTSGLDPNQIIEIRDLIRNFSKEKTVIFSTHILQEVQAMCDRVVIIDKGKIVADDQVKHLKDKSSSQHLIVAEFETLPEVEILKKIPEINEIETEGNSLKIYVNPGTDIRADIFKIASENNLTLIGLHKEDTSLENIFQQLTKDKKEK
jgi:ABC-2 type transport system ATP-binding protein